MSAVIERRARIEVLAVGKPLNLAVFAFTSSTSPVLRRVRAVPGGSWPGAGEHEQVIGEYPQPDPSLHPARAPVAAAPQSVTPFECADASFAASAPPQSCARSARTRRPTMTRQDYVAAT